MNSDQIQQEIAKAESSIRQGQNQLASLRQQLSEANDKTIKSLRVGDVFQLSKSINVCLIAVQLQYDRNLWGLVGSSNDLKPWNVPSFTGKEPDQAAVLKYLNYQKAFLIGNINNAIPKLLGALRQTHNKE